MSGEESKRISADDEEVVDFLDQGCMRDLHLRSRNTARSIVAAAKDQSTGPTLLYDVDY
jgi:hypothetical protein